MQASRTWFYWAYVALVMAASLRIGQMLLGDAKGSLVWLGAATAIWPPALLFIRSAIPNVTPNVRGYPGMLALSLVGAGMAVFNYGAEPLIPGRLEALLLTVILGVGGMALFKFWYLKGQRQATSEHSRE